MVANKISQYSPSRLLAITSGRHHWVVHYGNLIYNNRERDWCAKTCIFFFHRVSSGWASRRHGSIWLGFSFHMGLFLGKGFYIERHDFVSSATTTPVLGRCLIGVYYSHGIPILGYPRMGGQRAPKDWKQHLSCWLYWHFKASKRIFFLFVGKNAIRTNLPHMHYQEAKMGLTPWLHELIL